MPKSPFQRPAGLGANLLRGFEDLRLVLSTAPPGEDGVVSALSNALPETYKLSASVKRQGRAGQLSIKPAIVNAEAGPVGPFQYGVVANTAGVIVGFVDCGEQITLDKYESYKFAFPGVVLSVNV